MGELQTLYELVGASKEHEVTGIHQRMPQSCCGARLPGARRPEEQQVGAFVQPCSASR